MGIIKTTGIYLRLSPRLLSSFSLFLVLGLAETSSAADEQKPENKKSKSLTGLEILIICLGLLAVVGFSVFLFKMWQRKKREEQHARLLRLFEQDDELEVELGMRD